MSVGVIAVKKAQFGEGNGQILLDDMMCRGTEANLLSCPRRNNVPLFSSNCNHSEDAGVICEGEANCQLNEVLRSILYMKLI